MWSLALLRRFGGSPAISRSSDGNVYGPSTTRSMSGEVPRGFASTPPGGVAVECRVVRLGNGSGSVGVSSSIG